MISYSATTLTANDTQEKDSLALPQSRVLSIRQQLFCALASPFPLWEELWKPASCSLTRLSAHSPQVAGASRRGCPTEWPHTLSSGHFTHLRQTLPRKQQLKQFSNLILFAASNMVQV